MQDWASQYAENLAPAAFRPAGQLDAERAEAQAEAESDESSESEAEEPATEG